MEVLLVIWLAMGAIAAIIMTNKGRSGCGGFALGFLLGPFGIILALVVSSDQHEMTKRAELAGGMRKCPDCAELVKAEARKCRFCGYEFR